MNQQDLQQYKPLFDQLTAYVTECSGYNLVAFQDGMPCAEVKFPGGKFPFAIHPETPFAENVKLLRAAVQLHRWMATIPAIDLSKVR